MEDNDRNTGFNW